MCQEALPQGWEVSEWVGGSSWRSGIALDSLPEVQEGSRSPCGGPGEVGSHSQRARRGWEAILKGWEESRVFPGGP